jgi:hypothetical protein
MEMKATRSITRTANDGRVMVIEIERIKEVTDDIAYADGWNFPVGKKTVDLLEITLTAGDKMILRSHNAPEVLEEKYYRNYKEMRAKGAYARLGDAYVNEETYNLIVTALAEIDAELTGNPEFAEVKAMEDAKEAAKERAANAAREEYDRLVASGMCPKCQTWCYGDCEPH